MSIQRAEINRSSLAYHLPRCPIQHPVSFGGVDVGILGVRDDVWMEGGAER